MKKILISILLLIIGSIISYYASELRIKDQLILYDYIKNMSSISFAILGVWIATILPTSLSKVNEDLRLEAAKKVLDDLLPLIVPLQLSLAVMIFSFVLMSISSILSIQQALWKYAHYGRSLSIFIIYILFLIQAWSILYAILPVVGTTRKIGETLSRRSRVKQEKLKK